MTSGNTCLKTDDGGPSSCHELQKYRLLNTYSGPGSCSFFQHVQWREGGNEGGRKEGKGEHSQSGHPDQNPQRVRVLEMVVTSAPEADVTWRRQDGSLRSRFAVCASFNTFSHSSIVEGLPGATGVIIRDGYSVNFFQKYVL